jgi:hypothetical protein
MTVLIKSNQKVPKTLQGFFNRAYRWAKRPEFKPCTDDSNSCAYRNDEGTNACFIGACIPDNLYKRKMEGMRLSDLLKSLDVTVNVDKLQNLQHCHDDVVDHETKEDCIRALEDFARNNVLKIPAIK